MRYCAMNAQSPQGQSEEVMIVCWAWIYSVLTELHCVWPSAILEYQRLRKTIPEARRFIVIATY